MQASCETLRTLATACLSAAHLPAAVLPIQASRAVSIWEITTWILPMAPEHLRRVLAQNPGLPQGIAGKTSGTRWFSLADVATLRAHFTAVSRSLRYGPRGPSQTRAPLVVMMGPAGGTGRSTTLLHLAAAAALAGHKVLVIDADPAGRLGRDLGAMATVGAGDVLSLIARDCALHLQKVNQTRIDRAEAPLAVDDILSAALDISSADLVQPTAWPGLDVIAANAGMLRADQHIARWQQGLRRWPVAGALAAALDAGDLRTRYDLILCDTPRGLGPLAMAVLGSADIFLAPLPLRAQAQMALGAGLQSLSAAIEGVQAEDHAMARALGQPLALARGQEIYVLPVRAGGGAVPLVGFAAKLGDALLPVALPEIPQLAANGAAHFYDLDYRDLGRLAYAPIRQACDDVWQVVAKAVVKMHPNVSPRNLSAP